MTVGNSLENLTNNAFGGCSTLTEINVSSDNPHLRSENGVVYSKDKSTLCCYPQGKQGSFSIPNTVAVIGDNAFYGCSVLASLDIPETVTTIPSCFGGCTSLTAISIGKSVETIDAGCFYDAPLQTIYCQPYNPPTLEWKDGEGRPDPPFSNSVYDNAMLYVPSGCKSKYAEYAVSWGFHNIKEMDSGVEDVASEEAVIHVVDGSIVIDGVADDVPVEVYDMTGKAVYSGAAAEIPAMPRGIYIVRIGSKSVKVAV